MNRRNFRDPAWEPVREKSPAGPLRSLLAVLLVLTLGGGIWYYMRSIDEGVSTEMGINEGLRAVGADLWKTGTAAEVREMDPELIARIIEIRSALPEKVRIAVAPAENGPGLPVATHQILYFTGEMQVMSIRVNFDSAETKVDVLSVTAAQAVLEQIARKKQEAK